MNDLTKQTALTEKADVVNGRGDTPNKHDALTGAQPDGRAFPPGDDKTCHNWTSSTEGTGDRRAHRPSGAARRRGVALVEFLTPLARPRWRLQAQLAANRAGP